MFDFDVGKLMIFGIVALAVIPPKDLPRVMRTVGQIVGKMRRTAAEFQHQFMDAMREADLESVKKELTALNESATKEIAAISDAAKIDVAFDPAMAMREEVTGAVKGADAIGASEVALTKAEGEPPAVAAAEETAAAHAPEPAAIPVSVEAPHIETANQSAAE